jgi:hypothetical protein
MGFLDRVKASFAQAMGGKAKLTLEVATTTATPGAGIDYRVALVTTGPLKAEKVTIGLYGTERVRVWTSGSPAASRLNADADGSDPSPVQSLGGLSRDLSTFQQVEPVVAGELVLPAGESREWAGTLRLPEDLQPTYRGVDAQHTWRVRAVVWIPLGVDLVEETEIVVR